MIMPARLAETDPYKQITEVVGSGPFRLVANEYVAGNLAVFAKSERYEPRPEPASFPLVAIACWWIGSSGGSFPTPPLRPTRCSRRGRLVGLACARPAADAAQDSCVTVAPIDLYGPFGGLGRTACKARPPTSACAVPFLRRSIRSR